VSKRSRLWLPLWVTPRLLYSGGAVAVLFACVPGVPLFAVVATVAAAALVVATLVDLAILPSARAVSFERVIADHFALRVLGTLGYTCENRSRYALRVGIVEAPIRTLQYDIDEAIGDVPARSRAMIQRPVTPIARGADELGTLYCWLESPLGLVRRRLRVEAPMPIRVYPDLSAVERYGSLHVRNRLIEAGLRKMRLRGQGTEFESLREWSAGDPFRAIDWKATARRGKVMVAQHEVERSQNVMMVIDCGRLMTPRVEDQRKLDFAVTAALSVATIAGLANDKVGVVAFAKRILVASAPRSTRSSLASLSSSMYDLEPRFEESDYARAFMYLREHLHKRSLIVFFTDVIDPIAQSTVLAEIGSLAKRHLVVCVFMNDEAIDKALMDEPSDAPSAYRASVALGLQHERRTAAATLVQRGAIVIDVPARKLTTALIDEYLRVKQRGLL
jgi:uncharacterized protein (DUF58 family)